MKYAVTPSIGYAIMDLSSISEVKTMKEIILASSSPRRIEMFINHGFQPRVVPAHIDEALPFAMKPESSTMYLALKKAFHTAMSMDPAICGQPADCLIIAADTVVVFDGRITGKPSSQKEAFETLKKMKNRSHSVITGVCLLEKSGDIIISKKCLHEVTSVYFKDYSDSELRSYVKTDEPYDKAGGYAIQGIFSKYIDHIDGDYDNVVGLPWKKIEPYLPEPQAQ